MVNRFPKNKTINVRRLPRSPLWGCFANVIIIAVCLVTFGGVFWLFSDGDSEAAEFDNLPTLTPTSIIAVVTAISKPISPVIPPTPMATWTPLPTWTPAPTWTPVATITPLPTVTETATPTATPTAKPVLYSYSQLSSGAASVSVVSDNAYGYYRALCLGAGSPRIEPRVVGAPTLTGLHFKLWNDYGWSAINDYGEGVTFFLSDNPSTFHLQMFYYDDPVSDQVDILYPDSCTRVRVIYVEAAPPLADNVEVVGSDPISVTVRSD